VPVFVLCPDHNKPSGGVKQLYRQVDVLNRSGWEASIVHHTRGFRCSWFPNETRIAYTDDLNLGAADHLVVPEVFGPVIADIQPGVPKIVYNQGGYLTFHGYSLEKNASPSPYQHPDVHAALVVSEDSRRYLQYVFPDLSVHRLHYGVDPAVFLCGTQKRRRIAFMPRRNREDVRQVLNALNYRGALDGFDLAPIDAKGEYETAELLRDSLVFLSFGRSEGFGLPAAEAMACGCIVVGFHGMGGREFFLPEHSYPVPQGDLMAFVLTAERVLGIARRSPERLLGQGRRAAAFIRERYSLEREQEDIVHFWTRTAGAPQVRSRG
jgi:glycosyltransferase involved in cell wall biosynthesis